MYDIMTVNQMRREALQQEAEARRLVLLAQSDSQQSRRSISIGRIIQTLLVALR
jgi:hypothetical protein